MKRKHLTIAIAIAAIAAGAFLTGRSLYWHSFPYGPDVVRALKKAGSNRGELLKVLEHFSETPADSQKLRAAEFLIGNTLVTESLDTLSVAANQPFFDALAASYAKKENIFERFNQICDSVSKTLNDFKPPTAKYIFDARTITAHFLIEHINHCFEAKSQVSWGDSSSFDVFCQYLLPYKVSNTYWEKSREHWQRQYSHLADSVFGMQKAAMYIDKEIQASLTHGGAFYEGRYPFLYPVSFRNFVFTRVGTCTDICAASIDALRSMSIPSAQAVIPWWGNSNSEHYIVDIVSDEKRILYDNTQHIYYKQADELIPNMFWRTEVLDYSRKGIPEQVEIQHCRTFPKIYRICTLTQTESLADKTTEKIPDFFENAYLQDITAKYIKCADVSLKLNSDCKSRYVYLCCYNPETFGVVPVAWAETGQNQAEFKDMGVNVLYFPACYEDGRMKPVETPFVLDTNGICKPFDYRSIQKDTVVLFSKMPYRLNPFRYAHDIVGASIQLANANDLHDSVIVHKVDRLPYYMQNVEVAEKQAFRYVVFSFGVSARPMLAELECWGLDESGNEVKLQGRVFGNSGTADHKTDNISDGDRLSYAIARKDKEPFFGIDLGSPTIITHIKYLPRNDDNAIVPDELYELFYWNGGWQSLGTQQGHSDNTLVYINVPRGSLMRLHNHTRGKENRPFTYENGKQKFR